MKLSLCMIVKNAEDTLHRALESCVGHVDEIIIVDTGSTDMTCEIAEAYADHLVDFEWTGSFSDARNFSMNLATHDRILILDSDEYVDESAWDEIHEALLDPDLVAAYLQIVNKTKQGPVIGEVFAQPRIFRNERADGSFEALRYRYAIHNQIEDSVLEFGPKFREHHGRPASIRSLSARIIHTGYDLTSEQIVEKYTPRIGGLRKEIKRCIREKNAPEQAYYEFQLALMLHMLYNVEDAIAIWETLDFNELNVQNRWYARQIASRAYLKVSDYPKAKAHCYGMFEAISAGHAQEPVTYALMGYVLCNSAEGNEKILRRGISFMVEAYFLSLDDAPGVRCLIDRNRLIQDIVMFLGGVDEFSAALIASVENPYKTLRTVQNECLLENDLAEV